MGKITNILIHPAFIALIITFLIIWILPPLFNKYEVELLEKQYSNSEFTGRIYYHDFDHDGNSEKLRQSHNAGTRFPYFCFYSNNDIIIGQWNFKGEWIENAVMIFGDYDNNGLEEVYGFTWENDSVFINGLELLSNISLVTERRFLFESSLNNKQIPAFIWSGKLTDLDGDSFKEVVFSVNNSFNLQPRAVFAFDIKKDSIYRSPLMGAGIRAIIFDDIDDDNLDEILIDNNATFNYTTNIPYPDSSSWLMVLDNNLTFMFDPIEFQTKYGKSGSCVLKTDTGNFIINIHQKINDLTFLNCVGIYNIQGQLLAEIQPDELQSGNKISFYAIDDRLYTVCDHQLFSIDAGLQMKKKKKLKKKLKIDSNIDLGNDSILEFVFNTIDNSQLVIYRDNFKHPVLLDAPGENFQPLSIKYTKNNPDLISINSDEVYYLFEYKRNPYYYYKYLIYIGIFIMLYGFFTIIFHFQNKRVRKQYEIERELNELKLITIRNQMNPHFTFNAINSVSSVIYKEDKKTAYDFFTKFSDLIRYTLKNADKIAVPLSEEIEFVTNYLELEKFRFKDKFEYNISIDRNVNQDIMVPRMIIQTFSENAVKHGLIHQDKKGLLKIQITQQGQILNLIIEDNGIGREAAAKLANHGTGKGMKIIDQIFDLYYKLNGKKIDHSITDIQDNDNHPLGTRINVELKI